MVFKGVFYSWIIQMGNLKNYLFKGTNQFCNTLPQLLRGSLICWMVEKEVTRNGKIYDNFKQVFYQTTVHELLAWESLVCFLKKKCRVLGLIPRNLKSMQEEAQESVILTSSSAYFSATLKLKALCPPPSSEISLWKYRKNPLF